MPVYIMRVLNGETVVVGDYASYYRDVDRVGKIVGISVDRISMLIKFPNEEIPGEFTRNEVVKRSLLDRLAAI
jgi:hypothetical protein